MRWSPPETSLAWWSSAIAVPCMTADARRSSLVRGGAPRRALHTPNTRVYVIPDGKVDIRILDPPDLRHRDRNPHAERRSSSACRTGSNSTCMPARSDSSDANFLWATSSNWSLAFTADPGATPGKPPILTWSGSTPKMPPTCSIRNAFRLLYHNRGFPPLPVFRFNLVPLIFSFLCPTSLVTKSTACLSYTLNRSEFSIAPLRGTADFTDASGTAAVSTSLTIGPDLQWEAVPAFYNHLVGWRLGLGRAGPRR